MKVLDQATSNNDIQEIVETLGMGNVFGGCFLKNELPKRTDSKYYIVNLDSSTTGKGGTHWTLLVIKDSTHAMYFDPFGLPPPKEVIDFTGTREVIYSSNEMQNIESVLCGYFCIYVMNELFSHKTFYDTLYRVSGNSDKFIKSYFRPL